MKVIVLTLSILITTVNYFSQKTYIPDDGFESYLISEGYDNILDDSVTTANIVGVTELIMNYPDALVPEIHDLTGIEDFSSLTTLMVNNNQLNSININNLNALRFLQCDDNNIAYLDLSNNSYLEELYCNNNNITHFDLSNNYYLEELYCNDNNINYLDVSNNPYLEKLYFNDNSLNYIDVSNNTNLTHLYCESNPINELYLGNNHNLIQLSAIDCSLLCLNLRSSNSIPINLQRLWIGFHIASNPNLNCIEVDDLAYYLYYHINNPNSTNFQYTGAYSDNCNNTCSSMNTENLISKLHIYPNPTNKNINISIDNFNGNIQTEVYDLIGNRLQISNENTISLADYSGGIYLFKVTYGDRVEQLKVVKDY